MAAISQSVRVGNAVVLHLPMKYISVGECSIYSIANAVYIHFSGGYIGCCRTCILRQTYSPSAVRFLILHQMKLSAVEKEYSLEAVLDLSCDDLG